MLHIIVQFLLTILSVVKKRIENKNRDFKELFLPEPWTIFPWKIQHSPAFNSILSKLFFFYIQSNTLASCQHIVSWFIIFMQKFSLCEYGKIFKQPLSKVGSVSANETVKALSCLIPQ